MNESNIYLKGIEELSINELPTDLKEHIEQEEKSQLQQLEELSKEAQQFSIEILDLDRSLMSYDSDQVKQIIETLQDESKALKDAYNREINIPKYQATSLKFDIDKVLCKLFGPKFFEEEPKEEPKL